MLERVIINYLYALSYYLLMRYLILLLVLFISGCTCTSEALLCPDGSSVSRTGPDCSFAACSSDCISRVRNCPVSYDPVCGWFNQSIKCFRYPCAANYDNACLACSSPQVSHWTNGVCPTIPNCTSIGGTWLNSSKECIGITSEKCTQLNGTFDPCASACRNDPTATVCTMQCVEVCKVE